MAGPCSGTICAKCRISPARSGTSSQQTPASERRYLRKEPAAAQHWSSITCRALLLPEPWRPRKPVRRQPSGLGALADPIAKVRLGPRLIAQPPAEPIGQAKHLCIRQSTVAVALQDHAAAARHLGHLLERKDQQLAVVANDRNVVAVDRDA